jgi:hypothetical protein
MRTLAELIDEQEPGWPIVEGWLRDAKNPVEVLPVEPARAGQVLTCLQVTTRSPMGAIAYHSGGLVVDGWLRILGGGGPRMHADLARWNGLGEEPIFGGIRGAVIVALDLLGGVFALQGDTRQVSYFTPDSLTWQSLERGYSEFVHTMLHANLDQFFAGLRWDGWREQVKSLALDDGFSVYPFLWTREAKERPPSRRPAAMREIVGLAFEAAQKLGGG